MPTQKSYDNYDNCVCVPTSAFNQEKALVGSFLVIVKTDCEPDGSSAAPALSQSLHWWVVAACQPAPAWCCVITSRFQPG